MSPAKLRFSDAAYAADTAGSKLRNWLARRQVNLPSGSADGWREFSFADVAVLAIVAKLVEFGIKVEAASTVVEKLAKDHPEVFNPVIPNPESVEAMWNNRVVRIWPTEDGLAHDVISLWDWRARRKEPFTAAIYLDVGKILRAAFSRAIEANSDGAAT